MNSFVKYLSERLSDYPIHVTDYGVLVNADNLDIMNKFPDNKFDLLLTDPPYGIGEDGGGNHTRGIGSGFNKDGTKRTGVADVTKFTPKKWDRDIPPAEYFQESIRITKNQIIFGGNYFQSVMIDDETNYTIVGDKVIYFKKPALGKTICWIIWRKLTDQSIWADFEMAWTSFDTACKEYSFRWNGMLQGNMKKKDKRIHPTQKPVQVIRYILRDYTEDANTVLDTHSGSGTTAVACIDLKRYYLCIEKDEEYFDLSSERIEKYKHGYNSKQKDTDDKEYIQKSLL